MAARLLSGHRTKTGGSHLAHARRVALAVRTCSSEALDGDEQRAFIAALLHDVMEKAGVTIAELRTMTDDERVVELVQILTQRIGESDRSYLARCASDPTALVIKRIDLEDKFVLLGATAPPDVIARVQRRARRRMALLEQIAAAAPLGTTARGVVATLPPRQG
jgi:(p)ppGpp synthase/HD superfamily hydrolase